MMDLRDAPAYEAGLDSEATTTNEAAAPVRRKRMRTRLLLAAVVGFLSLSMTGCSPSGVTAIMPGIWHHQVQIFGQTYTEQWVIQPNGNYANGLTDPFGNGITGQFGTWQTIEKQSRFRLNQPTNYFPSQYCGPLGCNPILPSPGESFIVTINNQNSISTRSLTTGAISNWQRQ